MDGSLEEILTHLTCQRKNKHIITWDGGKLGLMILMIDFVFSFHG